MFRKAQQSVAHQSKLPSSFGLGNRDLKSLQEVLNTEKDFIKSNSRSAQDFHKVAESIKVWGDAEGEDLQDVLGKLSLLLEHYTTAQTRFNAHLSTIRQHFKSIRTREESLAEMKSRKRSLGSKIDGVEKKLAKMGPENKELMRTTALLKDLRAEMEDLRVEVQTEEAAIGDFKRRTAKEAMGIKCGGLLEFAEKMTIIAEVGKLMIEEIPLEYTSAGVPRAEYRGAANTDQLLQQATRSLADVGFAPAAGGMPGFSRGDMSGARGSEWDDSAQQDRLYADNNQQQQQDHSYQGSHQPDEPYADYDVNEASETPHEAQDSSVMPVFAAPAAIPRLRNDSINTGRDSTGGLRDTATDEWRRSQIENKLEPGMYVNHTSTPIADQFASRSPDDVQVGGTGLRMVGDGDRYDSTESFGAGGNASQMPNSAYNNTSNGITHAPPPRLSTPAPLDTSLQTPAESHAHPAIPNSIPQDDASYFQSVGSTRAAQQALRRPTSPSGSMVTASQSITGGIGPSIPASPYETQPEGRKMTAAAFRKGFARNASSQQVPAASGSSQGGAHAPDNGNALEDGTAPLAIRKRLSAVPGQSGAGYDDNPAPPYDDAERHASVYGGYAGAEEYGQNYAEPASRPSVPGQFYQSYGNSRPTSAAGWRTPNSRET